FLVCRRGWGGGGSGLGRAGLRRRACGACGQRGAERRNAPDDCHAVPCPRAREQLLASALSSGNQTLACDEPRSAVLLLPFAELALQPACRRQEQLSEADHDSAAQRVEKVGLEVEGDIPRSIVDLGPAVEHVVELQL